MNVADSRRVLAYKIEEWRHRPLIWGLYDCCQFTADVVMSFTGIDLRTRFPAYRSRDEAMRIIGQHGGMVSLISCALNLIPGFCAIPVAQAMCCDVIAADFGDGIAAGICCGVQCCTVGPHGLVFQPTQQADAAWRLESL